MIKVCRHTWDVYKMIKVCRHTWGCIQDDKGVSSYMGIVIYKMIKVCRHTWGYTR